MKIAIIGAAGSVGSPVAFYLATQGLVNEILMVGGKKQNVLKQHAMDISTAVSTKDVHVYTGGYDDLSGSDIVINTAGVPQGVIASRMEGLSENILLIKEIVSKIKEHCPDAIIITVTNPVGPLNYATYLAGGFDRKKVFGYSINDSFRLREMIAKAFKVKAAQVDGTVIGEHGSTQVLLFSSVKIDGKPVEVSEAIKQSIKAEIPNILKTYEDLKSGRTSGWTCAIGLALFVKAIATDSGEMLPCSVVLDGEYGVHNLSMSVPATIGRDGIKDILEWDLAHDEQEGLKVTIDTLRQAMNVVEESLS